MAVKKNLKKKTKKNQVTKTSTNLFSIVRFFFYFLAAREGARA